MNVDDTLLLAYVDGELSADRRAEVEAAAAHSPDVAGRLAALRASALPYAAAFDKQVIPPFPVGLSERISELVSVSTVPARAPAVSRRHFWTTGSGLRVAAAFFAGAVISGVLLTFMSGHRGTATVDSSWVKAIADYQVLYTRETVANVVEDPSLTEKILGELRQNDGLPVVIPDLRSAGLTFKRVQRLSVHNQPVVQIVYLPEHGGDPVALCLTRSTQPDEVPRGRVVDDMQAVEWRQDNMDYVLLARQAQLDLADLGHRIAHGHVANLYGRLEYHPDASREETGKGA
jgi:anti-sigma factor RsiW